MSSKDFAKKIVKISIEKGSVDNISCLVIKLN
jgi:serine/threonine protein phosphatase PrpC